MGRRSATVTQVTTRPRLEALLADACQVTAANGPLPFPPESCDGKAAVSLLVPAGVKVSLTPRPSVGEPRLLAVNGPGTLEVAPTALAWRGVWWVLGPAGVPSTGSVEVRGALVVDAAVDVHALNVVQDDEMVALVLTERTEGCVPLYATPDGRPRKVPPR